MEISRSLLIGLNLGNGTTLLKFRGSSGENLGEELSAEVGDFTTSSQESTVTVKATYGDDITKGGSGSMKGVLFSNIHVSEVQLPVVIEQFYWDKRTCKNQTSAMALTGITYEKIRRTYTVKPVHFACSDSLPCTEVMVNVMELKPHQELYHIYDPFYWRTFWRLYSLAVPPAECLQIGKPSNNRVDRVHDAC
ncbi:hypothetical protein RJ639_008149 [Escallonia herrerae]|uniref:Uncharacterized protein n=1 Tax=Escallonia herrerae TaxID=1293975 RepID=A0AA88VTT2_9ASTE|nr:hypothetical protein RJ639_008149 [Escallonia herrerae]